jgi:hypothetical protein
MISLGIGKSPASLFAAALAFGAPDDGLAGRLSALDFLVGALQAVCLSDGQRIESARRVVPAGWRLTDIEDHIDVQIGPEALFQRHDSHERGWRGALTDGSGSLNVSVNDYRDLATPGDFSAWFRISPENVVDLDTFQRRTGMTFRPRGPAIEGRDPSRDRSRPGEEIIISGWQPSERQFARTQSFTLEPSPRGIEINATRYWGAGYPEQSLTVTCNSRERDGG